MNDPPPRGPPPRGPQQRRKKNYHSNNRGPRNTQIYKRRAGEGNPELGFFSSVPSLNDLTLQNRKRTRKHYGGGGGGGQYRRYGRTSADGRATPMSVPRAPTPARFPFTAINPLVTPTLSGHGADGAADKLEAEGFCGQGLDFFGTNNEQRLVFYDSDEGHGAEPSEGASHSHSHSHSHGLNNGEVHEGEVADNQAGGAGGLEDAHSSGEERFVEERGGSLYLSQRIIRRLRERVAQQDAYIAELEDENLKFKERMDLLSGQIARQDGEAASGGDGSDEAAAAAAPAAAVTVQETAALQQQQQEEAGIVSYAASEAAKPNLRCPEETLNSLTTQ